MVAASAGSDARRRSCHSGDSVDKFSTEQNVGVVEHALLERDDDELGFGEVCSEPVFTGEGG